MSGRAPRPCFPAQQDVDGKILDALLANVSPISTSELAARIGHDPSVKGLVASSSGGRNVFNGITARGREHVERQRTQAPDSIGSVSN